MRLYQGISDHDPVVLPRENDFFRKYHTSHPVNRARHRFHRIFTNVFVTVRAETPALVLVQSQIEFGTVLNHRLVERREQDMIIVIQLRHGHNEQKIGRAHV